MIVPPAIRPKIAARSFDCRWAGGSLYNSGVKKWSRADVRARSPEGTRRYKLHPRPPDDDDPVPHPKLHHVDGHDPNFANRFGGLIVCQPHERLAVAASSSWKHRCGLNARLDFG